MVIETESKSESVSQKINWKEIKAQKKIIKAKGEAPTDIEEQIARALVELEINTKEIAPDLRDLFITSAKELETTVGHKSIVIFVPHRLHKRFQKIQSRLVRELEKKFSGRHVMIVAQRTILPKNFARKAPGTVRARSRTLTKVHEAILDDIVYPTAIVGKSTRVRLDGRHVLKVQLDPKDVKEVDYKLKSFTAVYKRLTNKTVEFIFPTEE